MTLVQRGTRWNLLGAVLFAAIPALGAAGATAGPEKLDSALLCAAIHGRGERKVLIQFTAPPTPADAVRVGKSGVHLGRCLGDGRTVTAKLPARRLAALANDPRVARVSLDAPVRANLVQEEQSLLDPVQPWNGTLRETIGLDGTGRTVAVLDSGIANVPGLSGGISGFYTAIGGNVVPASKSDEYGHGTHVAGIIGGTGVGSFHNVDGVAGGARLIGVRVLDSNGIGQTSDVIAAIDWCVSHRKPYGIDAINLSLSHPPYESYTTDPLCQAVERAWKAGIVVVCSAGNRGRDGYETIGSPGNDPWVITVGAMNTKGTWDRSDDVAATYSAKGPTVGDHILKPDVLVPGNKVSSWAAWGSVLYNDPNTVLDGAPIGGYYPFMVMSGTSMAAPFVTGLSLLMRQQDPLVTPDQVKARLMVTADKVGGDMFTRGAGYVNATRAMAFSTNADLSAVSPTVVPTADGGFTLVGTLSGSALIWGDSSKWGTSVIWGDRLLRGYSVMWGDVFGSGADTFLQGDIIRRVPSLLWGDVFPVADDTGSVASESILAFGD